MTGKWTKPITLKVPTAQKYHTIYSTADAAFVLMHLWPSPTGPKHLRAREVCLAVLSGEMPPNEARKAFLAAADEAKVFIYEK